MTSRPWPAAVGSGARCLLGLLLAAAVLMPQAAAAHQRLVSATPTAGDTLATVPDAIRLTFNQAVEPALARLHLTGPAGEVRLGQPGVPPDAPQVLRAAIAGTLVAGTYTVHWVVTSADGHPVRGEYQFTIEPGATGLMVDTAVAAGVSPPSAVAEDAPPAGMPGGFDAASPLYVAVRWLTFAGLLVVIGVASFALLLLPALRRRAAALPPEVLAAARTRAASLGLLAAVVLVAALLLRLYAQFLALYGSDASLAGAPLGVMLVRSLWGWGWILQAVATVAALTGLWAARRGRAAGWALAGAATLALSATPALSGHAAAASGIAVVMDTLHVLAAGGWLGTLLLVVTVGLPVILRGAPSSMTTAAALVGAFSPLALAFAGVLTLTGVYSAWLHLPDVPALWGSAYGQALLLKLAILSVVFVTGAYNWLRVRPALENGSDARPLKRSAAVELAAGLLVLGATAVLVARQPPAHEEQRASAPAASSAPAPQNRSGS